MSDRIQAIEVVLAAIEDPKCTCEWVNIEVGYQRVTETVDCPTHTALGEAVIVVDALTKAGLFGVEREIDRLRDSLTRTKAAHDKALSILGAEVESIEDAAARVVRERDETVAAAVPTLAVDRTVRLIDGPAYWRVATWDVTELDGERAAVVVLRPRDAAGAS